MDRRSKLIRICITLAAIAFVGALQVRSTSAANGSVSYTYDALGRLTSVSYDTGVCIRYTYDANGNRLSETIVVAVAGTTGMWGCFNWGQALWGS